MATLTIYRGLPGSGKTTDCRKKVAENPLHRVRINRDDYRAMMFGGWTGKMEHEIAVTKATDAAVAALLDKGYDVYMDNTFLVQRHARDARMLALRHGADFEVIDMTYVPLETCLQRDRQRIVDGEEGVGDDVINTMYHKYLKGKPYPLELPLSPNPDFTGDLYIPNPELPGAYVVDIDGTVALMTGRDPYDETRVHEDRPNESVIHVVRQLWYAGHRIIFVSGRHDVCYGATYEWLKQHVRIPDFKLLMRKDGDNRKDYLIKREIFDAEIRFNYNVLGCFDDRQQVVDAYRALGLTVFQVAPGNF